LRLFSYVVARDYGFAPNPFFNVCTLATCKPGIRRLAQVGDWVIGTGTANRNRAGYLVYAMKVAETMTFEGYWNDPRFQLKKPNLRSSKKVAFGDNIYSRAPAGGAWCQLDSHHSFANGSPNPANIENDTKADRMLIGTEFVYWGGSARQRPSPTGSRI
jgi:Nucleotide modification associated domain 2